MLTENQKQTLAAHIRANTDADVISALAVRNDTALAVWYNQASASLAWSKSVSAIDLFNEMNISTFDNLSAGKRDAWKLILDFSPIDASKVQIRTAFADIWGAGANAFISVCTEYAKNIELVFGGTNETSGSVTALNRIFVGTVSVEDISKALNAY